MAETTYPSPTNNRTITDIQYERWGVPHHPDGIVGTPADSNLGYADATGLQVKVRPGKTAWVRGHIYESDTAGDTIKTIAANSSGQPRIDRLMLGLDRTTWDVTCYVVQGTPGAGAVPPAPVQNFGSTGKFEIPIGRIAVANGATTINAVDFTNEGWYVNRGQVLCSAPTRPYGPQLGDRIYETDTQTFRQWDGSVWQVIGFNPNQLFAYRTSDAASFVNTTTLASDPMLQVNVAPNAIYSVYSEVFYSSSTTADLKIGWVAPAAATFAWNIGGAGSTETTATAKIYVGSASVTGYDVVAGVDPFTTVVTRPSGLLVTGANGGTFQMQYAQGTLDNVYGTSVKANSSLLLVRRA